MEVLDNLEFSDTELITIGNSSNSKNIILRSSGFADFKQVNVNQILKVGGDNVQIDPDGSATFTGSIGSGFHGINLNNVGSGVQNEFLQLLFPGDGGYTRKTTIYTDGSAIFAGSVDVAGLTVNGPPVTGDVDLSGYDTSAEVDAKISAIPSVDLSGYDTSIEVDAKIAAIPPVDLGGYDTSAQVNAKIANLENALINGSSSRSLNTLVELSTALGDDANFATTVTNSLAGKIDLSGATFSGNIKLGDNNRLKFGNGDDLQIYHDGNNSIIREGSGQDNFILKVVEQLQSEIRIKVQ